MTTLVRAGRRERLEPRTHHPYRRRPGGSAALLSAGHLALDVLTGSIAVLLPTLQRRFELDAGGVALLVGIELVAASLTQPLLGALADRYGRTRVAAAGLAVGAVLLSTLALAPSVPVLVAALVGGGLASAAFHPAANAAARRTAWGRTGELAVGMVGAAGMLGVAGGPLLVVLLLGIGGPALVPALALPAIAIAALLLTRATDEPPVPLEAPERRRIAVSTLHTRPILLLLAVGILSSLAFTTVVNSLPLWLVSVHGMAPDAPLIGVSLALVFGGAALGGVVAVVGANRLGRARVLLGTLVLAPVPVLALLAATPGSGWYLGGLVGAGLLLQAGVPLLVLAGQDAAPDRAGAASGLLFGVTAGIAGLAYPLIGQLQTAWGFVPAVQLTVALLAPASLLAWLATRARASVSGQERSTRPTDA
jgi:MFS transporter, FSR family, fosmidomycin resistance protein